MSITSITHSVSGRIAAGAVGAVMALSLFGTALPVSAAGLTSAQVQSILSLLQSFGADQGTINNVQAALTGQPTTGGSTGGSGASCPALSRDLTVGSTGSDVQALQVYLNASGAQVSASGAGSPGNESSYFGSLTRSAVAKWQASNGVSPAAGYVGPLTRAAIASKCGGSTGGTTGGSTGGTTVPTGPGLTVSASAQPSNTLAPEGALRVPFTTFTVTNNTGAAVTVNSVTVERTGLGKDNNFDGLVLVDQNGIQIGNAKTLNSNHQSNLDGFTLNAGESRTLTVAGNIKDNSDANAGQVVSVAVVAINTSVPVAGSLPITGASQTINTSLSIGTVSTTTSSFDPGSAQTKNIGDTDVRFSGLRFTAGSSEDVKLASVRWRQVGSASSGDITNVMTVVDGTSYPTTVDSTGKYYTTVFPGGLLVTKGNSIDMYIKGDLVGNNSSSRTVDFDIDRNSDAYFVGQTYGYGAAFSPSYTNTPWFNGYATTINAGSATTIGKATEVPAQNIAVNIPNQPLGGFVTDFRGEAVSFTQMIFNIATTSTGNGFLTSVSLVDENGTVVAGPVDAAFLSASKQKVTFTDTVTFPTGRHIYTLKGKLPSGFTNNGTLIVDTTPSGWSSPTGATTGTTITISQGNFTMNTMTVKAATSSITMSTQPASQNIVAGGNGVIFGNVQIDASQSGEDIRMSSIPLRSDSQTGLTSCQLWNGSTALNTGSNVPTSLDGTDTFTFDNPLVIPKGTVVTLTIKCNTTTSATGTYTWSVNVADTFTATGVTSGNSITPTVTTGNAGTMTVASGSVTVTVDSSSPSYTPVSGGKTGQTMAVIKLRAANEAVNLQKLGLTLTSSGNSASNAAGATTNSGVSDLIKVYIYDGSTEIGTATFTGVGTSATSTLSIPVTLPKDQDKLLTIKADLADIGVGLGGGIGDVVKIDPLNAEGTGSASGTTIKSGATAGVAGIRLFNTYPTLSLDTLSSTGAADGKLMRFKVTADSAGPVALFHFEFKVASTSGVTVTSVQLFGYTDSSYSSPISGQGTSGQIGATTDNITNNTAFAIEPSSTPVVVPAGGTRYFELKASVTGVDTGDSFVTTLIGDSAYPTNLTSGYNVSTSTAATSTSEGNFNFVWSGQSTTSSSYYDNDWSNGYGLPGYSASGLIQTRSQ